MRLPIAGGNWNNGGNAGLAALNCNNERSNTNNNIGFRPALGATSEGATATAARPAHPSKGRSILGQAPKHEQVRSGGRFAEARPFPA